MRSRPEVRSRKKLLVVRSKILELSATGDGGLSRLESIGTLQGRTVNRTGEQFCFFVQKILHVKFCVHVKLLSTEVTGKYAGRLNQKTSAVHVQPVK